VASSQPTSGRRLGRYHPRATNSAAAAAALSAASVEGIEQATQQVVKRINELARPVKGRHDVAQVASIAARDEEIGNLIADAMDRVGRDGVIEVRGKPDLRQ